jgi:ABC-type uncharacterized transport system permease subunit
MGILPYIATALLYIAVALYYWRARRLPAPANAPPRSFAATGHYALLLPLALHGVTLFHSVYAADGLRLGVGSAVSAILFVTVLIYWLGTFFYRLEGLQTLVLPLAAGASLLPFVFPAMKTLPNTGFAAFKIHLLISMLAYALFTIASLHVLLMAVLERRLHGGTLPFALQGLPPLLAMEALLFRIIWAGFVLLTLSLASGVLFSEELFGKAAQLTHKTIFGVLSWIIFAALLTGRHVYGWRGRIAVRWTLAGFLMLVFAYIGSKFVLEVILRR